MIVSENKIHTNAIIRKKIKTSKKMGDMITEIFDEKVAGIYPTCNHTDRLKKYNIHPYTWLLYFGFITRKKGKLLEIDFSEYQIEMIRDFFTILPEIIEKYKKMDKNHRKLLEVLFISELKK